MTTKEQFQSFEKSNQSYKQYLGKVQSLEIIFLQNNHKNEKNLFDYTQMEPKARKIVLKSNAVLALTKQNKFCYLKQDFQKDQKSQIILRKIKHILCSLVRFDNYYLIKPIINQLAQQIWIDVNSSPSKLFPLRKNDLLKLGQKILKVRQLCWHDKSDRKIDQSYLDQTQLPSLTNTEQNQNDTQVQQIQKYCRFCKSSDEQTSLFIIPCKCVKQDKYCHFQCLKQYLKGRIKFKSNNLSFRLNWGNFDCLKCRHKFKLSYKIEKEQVQILQIPRPQPPYIIFQHSMSMVNQTNRYLQIVPMTQIKSICIGSSTKSHLPLSGQKSLQSSHCQVTYDPQFKKFLLNDLQSKYGTLIKVQQFMKIRPNHKDVRFQIGSSLLQTNVFRAQSGLKNFKLDNSNNIHDELKPQKSQDSIFFM